MSSSVTTSPACGPGMGRKTWPSSNTSRSTSCARPSPPDPSKTAASSPAGASTTSERSSTAQPDPFTRLPCHRPDGLGGDTGVERGGVELGVPEQDLDDADVDVRYF